MKKILLSLLLITSFIGYSQEYSYIDFGNSGTVTSGNWNNLVVSTQNQDGLTLNLIDSNGNTTGAVLTLTDSFDHINANGTTSPNGALPFPSSATRDSFFGATDAGFNGNVNPTGGFTLSGLDPTKYYSFSVFSSRTGVSDNRETLYTVVGSTTASQALNPSNNTSNTADILNIQPNASGEITLTAQPGPNNNNGFGFYYLGALQLIKSDTPIGDTTPDPELALTYPNGGHLWEVGKTVRIKWESISITDMQIEFSSDNGANWNVVATAPGSLQYYDYVVPNQISTDCLIRISGEGLADTSDGTFEIIPNEGDVFRIVVLGSSTAAGTGPSDGNNAWVNRYRTYLVEGDTRYEVINLALGGFATYNILPTGSTIPAGVNRTIDTERNITKALSLNPGGIIINMPSNDAASGYPVADQIANYNLISADAASANVPLWVTTPQPRNFGANTTNLNIQLQMITETYNLFGNDNTVDFWTGFPVADNNGILPQYDSGDGIHMNDAAHLILFQRILGKGIHTAVMNAALSVEDFQVATTKIFPNPMIQNCTIQFSEAVFGNVNVTMTDMLGKNVFSSNQTVSNNQIQVTRGTLKSGIYIMSINYNNKSVTSKIIIN
ncbi:T9SS type A sorting domain-containing protein [Subsaxibacter sp. CAU 1640]|uniref:T9SS type A sorting domain-containing protein n=1 Tax=Subsaxibacter sp. CAU 1640 TaxID=2933271 RepID=UPI002003C72C|nr:T9SS type A sorting domain-containing protein [Subsaxibacter sp. CAU 1640]MCK7590678.1 T9SS type A sorting domain-containing protein [Subsaxibacter sp. CAU 1640]